MAEILLEIKEAKKRNAARRSASKRSKSRKNQRKSSPQDSNEKEGGPISLKTSNDGNSPLKFTLGR